ncbi:FMN-binding protein [Serinibacter salmoneus]|uniref:FMN-binding protein n=1 Tax=Serinibacter salmoneus TaxID=556530 RepID=A0A2A9D617_9MICO|nr:FMN-binding protein [Serinibacter salmoneus]PFG21289.1 FMN-binding protein [Serinibacter salmoneus]
MRRILLTALSTASALALLLSYRTSTEVVRPAPPQVAASAAGQTESEVSAGSATSPSQETGEAADGDTSDSDADTDTSDTSEAITYTGDPIPVAFGTLQVEITVVDGAITRATAIDYPYTDPRDIQLNGEAIPILEAATLEAQSADIDLVTGATFTSQGYIDSLQSALDEAGL